MQTERSRRGRRHEGLLVLAALVALAFVARQVGVELAPEPSRTVDGAASAPPATAASAPDGFGESGESGESGEAAILEAFGARRSDVQVEVTCVVERVLSDDDEGSRHQRFVVELSGGHTLLVAHNIDLAERVPLEPGDELTLCGEYEWNERGGVVHWTHRDPAGRHPGGHIVHRGKTYE